MINLRIPDELRELIRDAAKSNNRSQTAEITSRLHESFVRDGSAKGAFTVRHRPAEEQSVRELVVTMELMLSQLDLMRREMDERLKVLKKEAD